MTPSTRSSASRTRSPSTGSSKMFRTPAALLLGEGQLDFVLKWKSSVLHEDLGRASKKTRRIRQPHRDFDKLLMQAGSAHRIMKTMLCEASKRQNVEVARPGQPRVLSEQGIHNTGQTDAWHGSEVVPVRTGPQCPSERPGSRFARLSAGEPGAMGRLMQLK